MIEYTFCKNFVEKYWFLRKSCHFPFLPIYKDIGQELQNP